MVFARRFSSGRHPHARKGRCFLGQFFWLVALIAIKYFLRKDVLTYILQTDKQTDRKIEES